MTPLRGARGIYKEPQELAAMVAPGLLTAASLRAAVSQAVIGAATLEIDAAAADEIRRGGGRSNFALEPGYRHTVCVSVNDEVVHGVPGARLLAAGDAVSIDSGAVLDGWNGDAAVTIVLDDPRNTERTAGRRRLSEVTENALWTGIAELARARHLNEVGEAIEASVEAAGEYGIVTDYVGHGIGRRMHEEPPVFNYRVRGRGPAVRPGLVVAIEPMIVTGGIETAVRDDGWTVATADGGDAAHWEHSVAVHEDGVWVLTAEDGGAAGLAPFGVVPVPVPGAPTT